MTFQPLTIRTGPLGDAADSAPATQVFGLSGGTLALEDDATHFGMVTDGSVQLHDAALQVELRAGMYFVSVGRATLRGDGRALVLSCPGYRGLRQVGGPLEGTGRLRYIDGCTDTLLVCPPRLGEPCLNHLHLPPHTSQSAHTHPSERIGAILRGRGECRARDADGRMVSFPLAPGMGWRIPAGCLHSFFTGDEALDVLAWHPDSDFGPTDENHPMVNRTLLPGR